MKIFRLALVLVLASSMFSAAEARHYRWFRMFGVIESLDEENLTIDLLTRRGIVTIQATEHTRIWMGDRFGEFGDLEAGMKAAVMGARKNGTLFAFRIVVPGRIANEIVRGSLDTIEYDNMTFLLTTRDETIAVQATECTLIIGCGIRRLTFKDLETGMEIVVFGRYEEEVLVARVIKVLVRD